MSNEFPPDWAIEKAVKPALHAINSYNLRNWTVEEIKRGAVHDLAYCLLSIAFARYIAEHEEAPVDPLYEALKAVVEMGRYDTREQTELLRGELAQRGFKIVEVGYADH